MKNYLTQRTILHSVDLKVDPVTGKTTLTLKGSNNYTFNSHNERSQTSVLLESKRLLDRKIGKTIFLMEGEDGLGFCVAFDNAGTFSYWNKDRMDERPQWVLNADPLTLSQILKDQ